MVFRQIKSYGSLFVKNGDEYIRFPIKQFSKLIMDENKNCNLCTQLGKPIDVAKSSFNRDCLESYIYHLNRHVKLYSFKQVPSG